MSSSQRTDMGRKAKERIREWYSWEYIVGEYEKLFLKNTMM